MKIAVLIDVLYPYMIGGGQKRYYEIYKRLAEKHEIHFFSMWWEGMPKGIFQMDGITVHPICKGSKEIYALNRRKVMPSMKYALAIIPHLLRNNFDIIDCNEFPFLHIIPAKILKRGAKLIVNWHEVWMWQYWCDYANLIVGTAGYIIQRFCAKVPNRIIAVSEHTKKELEKFGVKNAVVIPNGIDPNLIKKVKPSEKKCDVLYVGRLISEKNVDILLQAVAMMKEKISDIKVTIIGEGPELAKLKKLEGELGIGSNVEFAGFLPEHENVVSRMKSAKVFATASTREGFGIVIIESMACGLPVIAVEHPNSAASELINSSELLVDLDPKRISKAIVDLLKDKKKMKKVSKSMMEFSREFNWDKIAEDVEREISSLCFQS